MSDVVDTVPIPVSKGPVTLESIRRPVETELETFRSYFREAMRSDVGLLDRIIQYTLRRKGKQIRPLLVLLSAKMCGSINDATYQGAALVELLHTATLIHDDVVDEAEQRRGVFSINALWKSKIAVLFGDFLLSRGLLLALDHKRYELLHVVSDAVRRMSEGELLQIEKARRLDIDEATYFQIISDKTASLLSACTTCGAVSTTDDPKAIHAMRDIGEKIGLAFQIRDDLFDYGLDDIGKPLGIDLQEKKLTLPLIYALRQAPRSERKGILKIVRKSRKSRSDVGDVTRFVNSYGGLTYAESKMNQYAEEAKRLVLTFEPTMARDAIIDLIDYVVARRK